MRKVYEKYQVNKIKKIILKINYLSEMIKSKNCNSYLKDIDFYYVDSNLSFDNLDDLRLVYVKKAMFRRYSSPLRYDFVLKTQETGYIESNHYLVLKNYLKINKSSLRFVKRY